MRSFSAFIPMASILDIAYSAVANRRPFFSQGWGNLEILDQLLREDKRKIHKGAVKKIRVDWDADIPAGDVILRHGSFPSPYEYRLRVKGEQIISRLPHPASQASVQVVLPVRHSKSTPLVIHFAATGDAGFARRRMSLALPLARRGVASVILENPFYGVRRPSGQASHYLNQFSDILMMSRAAADEGIALLRYFHESGWKSLGVTGISMGGYVALTVAARSTLPVAVGAGIPTNSGGPVYLEGVLARHVAWEKLQEELNGRDPRAFMGSIFRISDLEHLPRPRRPDAAVIVGAENDAYIPRSATEAIGDTWPGCETRWIPSGHVGTFIFHRAALVEAVLDSFARLQNKPQRPRAPKSAAPAPRPRARKKRRSTR